MKNLKTFKQINERRKVYDREDLYSMEKWIKSVWDRLEGKEEDELMNFFTSVEEEFGEDIAKIIDGMMSADKLHYHQGGATVATGGIDTYEFITNFAHISETIEDLL